MPKKENRISHTLFKLLQNRACKYNAPSFTILYLKDATLCKDFKFSVVLSKKIYKKASRRNKLKRQAREVIKNFIVFHKIHNFCLLFFIKDKLKDKSFQEIQENIERDLAKFYKENKGN